MMGAKQKARIAELETEVAALTKERDAWKAEAERYAGLLPTPGLSLVDVARREVREKWSRLLDAVGA